MFKQTLSSKAQVSSASLHGACTSQTDAQAEDRDRTNTVIGRRNLWLLLVVFALTAVVQFNVARRSGLWADEVFSLAMATGHSLEHPAAAADPARGDFVESDHPVRAEELRRYLKHDHPPASPARVIRAVLLSDTNPPLYYILLYGWTLAFGTSDLVLRLFSIACSLACLPLLVGVARRTGGSGAVFPACILFAFSPLEIYYSTEGRMYSLLWLCVLATAWASLALQQRGEGTGIYVLWTVASAAGFLTHYFFVFPWLAIVAYLLIRPGKLARTRLVACLLLLAILILPWYARVPESLASWRITKDWLKWRPMGFDRLAASRELVVQFFSGHSDLWWDPGKLDFAAPILFGIVAIAMVWRLGIHVFGGQRLLLWLLFAAACAGPLVFDFVQHTYTEAFPRYAIAALPAAYLLAAVGLACFGQRTRVMMLVLIVLAWAPNILIIYRTQSRSWSPIREISRAASVNSAPTDLILVHSIPSGVLGIARYADGPVTLASWVGQLGMRQVPESIRKLAAGRTRIVFVKVHEVREPAPEEDWLRANAMVFRERRLASGRIVDFRPINSETF
jgi:4-amino-4-deoxy-L-arabinose transferase-like glycosyltransferase